MVMFMFIKSNFRFCIRFCHECGFDNVQVLKPKLLLNGIFGVCKHRADSVEDYKTWIRLTHYQESRLDMSSKHWNSPAVIVDITPRYMEPFTTGVLCVGIGYWSTRLTALTKFWEHEWTACVQLGAQTSHWGPDAHIVHEMPFNHINEELLKQTIREFIGAKEQLNPPLVSKEHLLLPKDGKRRTPPTVQSEPTPRLRECHSIDILSWKPPELKLRVITDGYFSVRTFAHDLGLKLSSCAHLTDLCLNRMGVITTDLCLKKYELHLKQMSEAIDKYSKLCSKDLKRFSDLKPDNRRRI